MAKSVFSKLKEENQGGNGDYLTAGDMATEMIPFGISRVKWDEGGGYKGADRWLLDVYAWYEDDLLTNDSDTGKLGLGPNQGRDKLMGATQKYIEDQGEPVGPCVLVRVKTKGQKSGRNSFLDLVPWDEETEQPVTDLEIVEAEEEEAPAPPPTRARRSAQPAPSRGARPARGQEPEPEDEPRPTRGSRAARSPEPESAPEPAPARRRRAAVSEPEPEERVSRPFVVPAEEEASEPQRDEADEFLAELFAADPDYAPTNTEIRTWALKKGIQVAPKGKLATNVTEAFWDAVDGLYPEEEAQREAAAAAPVVTRPKAAAPVQQGERKAAHGMTVRPDGKPLTPNAGESAQEITYTPGMNGVSIEPCPNCNQTIEERIFPPTEGEGLVMVHMCEGVPRVLAARPRA